MFLRQVTSESIRSLSFILANAHTWSLSMSLSTLWGNKMSKYWLDETNLQTISAIWNVWVAGFVTTRITTFDRLCMKSDIG